MLHRERSDSHLPHPLPVTEHAQPGEAHNGQIQGKSYVFSLMHQKLRVLEDSQKYPFAIQQFRALSSSQWEDNRKVRKAEGNALGMGSQNCAIHGIRHQIAFGTKRKWALASAA